MMRRLTFASLAVFALAGCGGGSGSSSGDTQAFAWLHPAPPPPGWHRASLPNRSATMAYPPSWSREVSDPGTVTAVLRSSKLGPFAGYLNATPQQGAETFDNWSSFRIQHNRDEGDRNVRLLASATDLPFRRAASGSCVIDSYVTESGHPFKEIACLVGSQKATTVIVASAPPALWHRVGPQLERAVSAFRT